MDATAPAIVPVDVEDLATPALLVDVPRLERNIARTASDLGGRVDLRPHVKTSKCLEVARRQREAGAIGFTCSTPAEVELLGEAGLGELLWAHLPVGPAKVRFAVRASRLWDVTLLVESVEQARALSAQAEREDVDLRVLLDVDTGQHRTGVDPTEAVERARAIAALPRVALRGILTHEGQVGAAGRDGREAAGEAAGRLLVETAAALREAGIAVEVVSIGSTPGLSTAPYVEGISEARPGTYVYFDANQHRLGSCGEDQWALSVLARVVSAESGEGRSVIIDAGLKAMSSDTLTPETGAGIVCDLELSPLPGVRFSTANEEHGFLDGPGAASLRVGDLVRIVPNHACGTVNMWSHCLAVGADGRTTPWEIAARH